MEIQYKFRTKSKNNTEIRSIHAREEEKVSGEHPTTMIATAIDRTKVVEERGKMKGCSKSEEKLAIRIETPTRYATSTDGQQYAAGFPRLMRVWKNNVGNWCSVCTPSKIPKHCFAHRLMICYVCTHGYHEETPTSVRNCHLLGRRLCESRSLALWAEGWPSPKYWIDDRP